MDFCYNSDGIEAYFGVVIFTVTSAQNVKTYSKLKLKTCF